MSNGAAGTIWYCVVVRDEATTQCMHYRCVWTQREAELYKVQIQQAEDRPGRVTSTVTIETLPGGELPKKIL
ncbi:MAG: hypothetical protein ACRD4Q_10845 [Candidatus Acidiferrales bacterium]